MHYRSLSAVILVFIRVAQITLLSGYQGDFARLSPSDSYMRTVSILCRLGRVSLLSHTTADDGHTSTGRAVDMHDHASSV